RALHSEPPRKQTRCDTRVIAFTKPVLFPIKKGETHGTRKTRHQAPGTAQEVPPEDKRLFPHQEQALPIRAGSRQSRRSLRQTRPPREEARVSQALDSARGCRRPEQWPHLRPVDSRTKSCRRCAGPQSPRGYRSEGRCGFRATRSQSQSRRSAASQGKARVTAQR